MSRAATKNGARKPPALPSPQLVPLDQLKPHPRNYRAHPDDQLEHLARSLKEHGVYRNVVVAKDGTILAGHGVVLAARKLGLTELPVIRLPLSPDEPRAMKIVVGDNEIGHLSEIDDRMLSELLRELKEIDVDHLVGTGYDEMMLANLVYVTRAAGEIEDHDAAANWVGMPEHVTVEQPYRVVVACADEKIRGDLLALLGITKVHKKLGRLVSVRWPAEDVRTTTTIRFEDASPGERARKVR